jgi:3'(2'), 5'-bisphosphate nucleotidase
MAELLPYLSLAIKASVLAGKKIMDVYAGDFDVKSKSDNSPLTVADERAHHKIIEVLKESNLPVLSEEGRSINYEERKNWNMFWMVDPLDGTKEFVKRNGEFTVNIALIKNQVPVLGVIYAPVLQTIYFGCEGKGSYKLEADDEYLHHLIFSQHIYDRIVQSAVKLPAKQNKNKFTVVASRSHMTAETESFIDQLQKENGEVELISKGSSLKLCLVAEGLADVYPRFAPTMEWDTAAGQAIAVNAGKNVTNAAEHGPVLYNKEDLLNPWFIVR